MVIINNTELSDEHIARIHQAGYKFTYINSYIGIGDWAKPVDWWIRRRSKIYTHNEYEFSDGISFSSSMRFDIGTGKSEGVRFRDIDYTKHPERWKKNLLILPQLIEQNIRRRAEILAALKLKYDKRAIVGSLITGQHNPWDFFCSEVVYDIIACDLLLPVLN